MMNFEARNGNFETSVVVKNHRMKQREQRSLGVCWQWKANGQCVKGNNCSFRHDMDKRGKSSPSNPSPNSFMRQNERKPSRTPSPRGKSPSGRMSRWPCKDYLRGTCNNSFCEKWHPPECLYYKTKSGCRFGEKCSFAHRQVDEQPTKRSKSNNDKSAVAMLKKGNWQERESVSDACHVQELGTFLTMNVLEDTPAVLSLGKLCDEHGYSYDWINGQKPHLIKKKRYSDTVQYGELRSDRGSWFINEFFLQFSLFNIHDTFKAGDWSSQVFLKLVYLTTHDIFNCVKRKCG